MYPYSLTNREIEIAKYIIKGYSNSEIAKMLFVSKSTVKVHVSNILQKTKAKNRVNLAYILGSIEI
jgi:DNA-binding NarL/FixJ family response regulator